MKPEIYTEIMENLRAIIENRYESVLKFCQEPDIDIDYIGLTKCFNQYRCQKMSLPTFLKIAKKLNFIQTDIQNASRSLHNVSLWAFLQFPHNDVYKALFDIQND
jgi:hypothetical protein